VPRCRALSLDIGDAVFDFHNAVASEFDELKPTALEWEATITKDLTIEVAPDTPVRFVLIHNNHLGGSGWRLLALMHMLSSSHCTRCPEAPLRNSFPMSGIIKSQNMN
jgi:hypothetical protein